MYFEVNEVNRRYKQMWFKDNVSNWTTAPDNFLGWNYKRGLVAGLFGNFVQGSLTHFFVHFKEMLRHYEHPIGIKQMFIFFRATLSLQSFRNGLTSRYQYSAALAFFYTAPFLAVARYLNAGWSANAQFPQVSYFRKMPTSFIAAFVTAPLGIAVDMIHRAYHADLSFPPELRKGYKSFFDAMLKIPFNQGPYYLFKNTFPLFIKHLIGGSTGFFFFDFCLDKIGFMETIWMFPHWINVWTSAFIGAGMAGVFSHPLTMVVRQIVDFDVKNGKDLYGGDYRRAISKVWFAEDQSIMVGLFKTHFWYYTPQWVFTFVLAEHLGLFRYWRVSIYGGAGDNTKGGYIM